MIALPPPSAARSGAPSLGCSRAAACSYSPRSPTMAALPYDSPGAPSASVAFLASSAPSSSPASISRVRSSTNRPANGFSSTTTAAALRSGRRPSRPPSLSVSSTIVTILRIFTIAHSPRDWRLGSLAWRTLRPTAAAPEASAGAPALHLVEQQAVEQLRIEVGGLLRQQLAAPHHRLQLLHRRGGDEERRLASALAGRAHRLGPIRRVVHVTARLELGVVDAEQRAQQPLVQDGDGEPPPRRRRAGRPRDRGPRLGAQGEARRLAARHHAAAWRRRRERERIG